MLIKKVFSSLSLSVTRVVSSAYLRLLIFLPAILIPICDSSRPALCMMYSTYALNKQGNNRQPCHTPFSILNQSVVPCLVLTVASRSVSRFLRRQVRWSGIPISFRIFHSLLWSTKVFSVVDEAKVRTRHRTTNWVKIGKGVYQGCILSPCLFNLYEEYNMWNVGLDEE